MRHQNYTVGWICAVHTEFVAACELLDEEHPTLRTAPHDDNTYTLGRSGEHCVVIACLPQGRYGTVSAASVAKDMLRSFEAIRFALMVGIGGGAPSHSHNVRLGDIVVGCPVEKEGGVVPYDFGKAVQGQGFEQTRSLNSPPTFLLTALSKIRTYHERKGTHIGKSVQSTIEKNSRLRAKYQNPGAEYDRLYEASYTHRSRDHPCEACCSSSCPPLLKRPERELDPSEPMVHYGLIASADTLMKDAITRDRLSEKYNVVCFEMEAAGLMDHFPCVVIRGVCDYSDSHKNDKWQGYAALTAAVFAKELLGVIQAHEIDGEQLANTRLGE